MFVFSVVMMRVDAKLMGGRRNRWITDHGGYMHGYPTCYVDGSDRRVSINGIVIIKHTGDSRYDAW